MKQFYYVLVIYLDVDDDRLQVYHLASVDHTSLDDARLVRGSSGMAIFDTFEEAVAVADGLDADYYADVHICSMACEEV